MYELKMRLSVYVAVALCLLSVGSASAQYHLDNEAEYLTGTLVTEEFYGPPNYGETPETDRVEKAYILKLDTPIEIVGDIAAAIGADGQGIISTTTVSRVQLSGEFDTKSANKLIGQQVKLDGRLFPAHTGHHHTPMLADCSYIAKLERAVGFDNDASYDVNESNDSQVNKLEERTKDWGYLLVVSFRFLMHLSPTCRHLVYGVAGAVAVDAVIRKRE